jgi:Mrp family chromosome partitioning ATPase
LLLAIPDMVRQRRWLIWGKSAKTQTTRSGTDEISSGTAGNGLALWDQTPALQPFAEGLRERVITHFEVRNVNHKPKLVGVTGCNKGSGVTTLASGLAAALSKTGEGNVLLVDMNVEQGEAHSFYKGKPGFALADVLQPDSRGHAQVEENLYLASLRTGAKDKLAKVMPSHFMNLVPKLKASDYDYIIFDMPPVTPTSVTPRMASYMDMVLLVLESEKTGQLAASQASALMRESRGNVAAVLNKNHQYVPERLRGEL